MPFNDCNAHESTHANVRPRTRPPSNSKVMFSRFAKAIACCTLLVTTVSCRSCGIIEIRRPVVVPESTMIAPSCGTSSSAASAMRAFSSTRTACRESTVGWNPNRRTGIAPPCTRRTKPCFSSSVRSRRIVSGVTSRASARSITDARPPVLTRSTIAR